MIHTKKRDCTVAVPLNEALALPLYPNSNTEAHADMYAHIHTLMVRMEIDIHIPRTSKCCNALGIDEIC